MSPEQEAKRAIHDALCVVRNMIRDSRVVYGGGAPEIAMSIAVEDAAHSVSDIEQLSVLCFFHVGRPVHACMCVHARLHVWIYFLGGYPCCCCFLLSVFDCCG
jgi:hypothetical protein